MYVTSEKLKIYEKASLKVQWKSILQFRALFKGMMAPMASVSAMNAVFFGVYTGVLKKIDGDLENPKIRWVFVFIK